MDNILKSLQGRAFHLSDVIFNFISNKYSELILIEIPELKQEGFHPEVIREIIGYHRAQFLTEEYLQSRIDNPTTGTIDHLHAEITASIAAKLGMKSNYKGYAIELLRVAAHFHDSDRSFPQTMIQGEEEVRNDPAAYRAYKKLHAASSAERAAFHTKRAALNGFPSSEQFIRDLSYLIVNHELSGEKKDGINLIRPSEIDPSLNLNNLTDIVTDADSLAYFYANILTNWEECGKSKQLLSNKVHFMYDRMTPQTQNELRKSILSSKDHILGSPSKDQDINSIREVLLNICI